MSGKKSEMKVSGVGWGRWRSRLWEHGGHFSLELNFYSGGSTKRAGAQRFLTLFIFLAQRKEKMSATHSAIHRNEREKRTRLSNTRELPPIIAPPAGLVRSMSHPLRRFYMETEFFPFFVSSTNYSAAATPERGADGRTGERTRCLAASAAIHFPLIKNQLIRCSFSCHNLLSIKIQSNFSLNWINFILKKLISFKLNQSLLNWIYLIFITLILITLILITLSLIT